MELKERLFSKKPSGTDTDEKLEKIKDGLYKYGKVTIRFTANEPSKEGIKAFNTMYNKIIAELIDKGF